MNGEHSRGAGPDTATPRGTEATDDVSTISKPRKTTSGYQQVNFRQQLLQSVDQSASLPAVTPTWTKSRSMFRRPTARAVRTMDGRRNSWPRGSPSHVDLSSTHFHDHNDINERRGELNDLTSQARASSAAADNDIWASTNDEGTSRARPERSLLPRLRNLSESLRTTLDEIHSLVRPYLHDSTTRVKFQELMDELRSPINDLEATAANILTPSTVAPAPAEVDDSEDQSEDVPPLLQEYYDAAGWAGVLHERLVDLVYEISEAAAARRLDTTLPSLFETDSEKMFSHTKSGLKEELRQARRKALDLLQRCKDENIEMHYPPRSSLFDSVASSRPIISDSREMSPLGGLTPVPDELLANIPSTFMEVDHQHSLDSVLPGLGSSITGTASVTRWLSQVWDLQAWWPRADVRYDLAHSPWSHETLSMTSLPEYVRIDKSRTPVSKEDVNSSHRQLDDARSRTHGIQRRGDHGIRRTRSDLSLAFPARLTLPAFHLKRFPSI